VTADPLGFQETRAELASPAAGDLEDGGERAVKE
jgi:hypothetical protein